MSDINSGLPVRTQLPGQSNYDDVIFKLADGTTSSQLAKVDANGSQQTIIADATGAAVTSQTNGGQRALDVGINVAGVQIDPRQIRALTATDVVTANQGSAAATHASPWWIRLTDGTNDSAILATGELKVAVTQPLPAGTNAIGTVNVSNLPTTVDTSYGAVGASTVRSAAQVGNATGAADFNNGASGAQTLRVAANLAVAGANVTTLNPVPVTVVSETLGAEVNKFNTNVAVAAAASVNHDYTITALKTFKGRKFWISGSGKVKAEVQISPDGTTFTTYWVGFNSTGNPNISIDLDLLTITDTGVGSKIRIIVTNKDNQAQDVYSTISGSEY